MTLSKYQVLKNFFLKKGYHQRINSHTIYYKGSENIAEEEAEVF